MKIKISPLMPIMAILVMLTGNIEMYIITYCVMAIHELAHLLASLGIGLKAESITFSAFGVNLKLRNKLINSLSDEIILYSAGPLINGIFALAAMALKNTMLYRLNIALFIMNLMPIIPLDGGMIALRLLSYRFGTNASKRILNAFSVILATVLLAFTVASLMYKEINLSAFIMAVFLIGNILTSKEKYDVDIINCLSSPEKRSNKAKITIINSGHPLLDTIKEFSPAYTTVAIIMDSDGKVTEIISEKEILEKYSEYSLD